MGKHNHKAVWTAIVLQQVLGFVWYSDALFLRPWLLGLGKSFDELQAANSLPYISTFLAATFLSYLMSWLFQIAVIEDWKDGLFTGMLFGVGFLAPTLISHYMFMKLPSSVIMIDASKEIIGAGIAGIILATWRAEHTQETA